jgi:hypothetical protein
MTTDYNRSYVYEQCLYIRHGLKAGNLVILDRTFLVFVIVDLQQGLVFVMARDINDWEDYIAELPENKGCSNMDLRIITLQREDYYRSKMLARACQLVRQMRNSKEMSFVEELP